MHVLAGAPLAFPDSTVRDTAGRYEGFSYKGKPEICQRTCKERSLTQADGKSCGSAGAEEAPAADLMQSIRRFQSEAVGRVLKYSIFIKQINRSVPACPVWIYATILRSMFLS